MTVKRTLLAVLLFAFPLLVSAQSGSTNEVLKRIMDRVKANDAIAEGYGYYYEARTRDVDDDGHVLKEDKRLYRITWVEDKPYFELLKVDDHEPSPADKKEETDRRNKFVKSLHAKKPPEFKMDWDELFSKYDYKFEPSGTDEGYVVSFQPKPNGLKERTRMEKVFNNIGGKVWVDSEYNVTKAHLWLVRDVRFGLGILANLDELQLHYSQQKFGDNLWFPAVMSLNYDVRILLKGKHQQLDSRFFDIYPRPKDGMASGNSQR